MAIDSMVESAGFLPNYGCDNYATQYQRDNLRVRLPSKCTTVAVKMWRHRDASNTLTGSLTTTILTHLLYFYQNVIIINFS